MEFCLVCLCSCVVAKVGDIVQDKNTFVLLNIILQLALDCSKWSFALFVCVAVSLAKAGDIAQDRDTHVSLTSQISDKTEEPKTGTYLFLGTLKKRKKKEKKKKKDECRVLWDLSWSKNHFYDTTVVTVVCQFADGSTTQQSWVSVKHSSCSFATFLCKACDTD